MSRAPKSKDFDPEDVTYSTFRWITTDIGYAMGPSRANPYSGEIIDADIIFDASMVRFYKRDQQLYRTESGLTTEPDSPIQAARHGWSVPRNAAFGMGGWNDKAEDNGRALLAAWRKANRTIVHVRHDSVEPGSTLSPAHRSVSIGRLEGIVTDALSTISLAPRDRK